MCYPWYQIFLNSDQEGNDCIWKLLCHCIQILHSDIYSVCICISDITQKKTAGGSFSFLVPFKDQLSEEVAYNHGLRTHEGKITHFLWPKFRSQSQINIWQMDIKTLLFCRMNGWLMENMDKGPTIPKWVLIVQPKIPYNLSATEFICPICLPKPKSSGFQ